MQAHVPRDMVLELDPREPWTDGVVQIDPSKLPCLLKRRLLEREAKA